MSVQFELNKVTYVKRSDLKVGDFFEFTGSVWICTTPTDVNLYPAVDLYDGKEGSFDNQGIRHIPNLKVTVV